MSALLDVYSTLAYRTPVLGSLLSSVVVEILLISLGLYILSSLVQYPLQLLQSSSLSSSKRPFHSGFGISQLPRLSAAIPWFGHLLGLQRDSARYINRVIASTAAPIFTIDIPFKRIIVANPSIDRQLARHVSDTGLAQILAHVGPRVFSLGQSTVRIILDADPRPLHKVEFGGVENLKALSERSGVFLWDEMNKMDAVNDVDLAHWMFGLTVSATANAVWGVENPWRMDREFSEEFMNLSETFDSLSRPVAWLTAGSAYNSRKFLSTRLREFHNQHRESRVRTVAHAINVVAHSDPNWETNPDYYNIEMVSALGLLATPSTLSVWLVRHLLATPELLRVIMREVDGLEVVQAETLDSPKLDLAHVRTLCPWLVASWYETLRLHMTGVPRLARHAFSLAVPGTEPLSVSQGDIFLLPMCASNLDAATWGSDAASFNPGRFMASSGELNNSLIRKVRAFGVAGNLCPGRVFGFEVAMAVVAGTLRTFEIKRADGGGFWVPRVRKGFNVGFERCSPCLAAGRDCQFTAHPYELQAADLKRKHDELQARVSEHENLYDSLKTARPEETEEILRRIRAGKDVTSMTEDIQEGGLLLRLASSSSSSSQSNHQPPESEATRAGPMIRQAVAGSLLFSGSQAQHPGAQRQSSHGHPSRARLTSRFDHPEYVFERAWPDTQHMYAEESIFVDLPGYKLPVSRWTTVCDDDRLLSHLLLLFWSWDTICNRVIDRTMFEEDLVSLDPSGMYQPHRLCFCSPFLVNALLAVSCLYTTNQATFGEQGDLFTRGQAFAKEAERLLLFEDFRPFLPVAQGLALMHVYEGALGEGGKATTYHTRMHARYSELQLDDIPRSLDAAPAGTRECRESHALSWIQWGFYVWDWKPMHGLVRRLLIKRPNRPKIWRDAATSPLCNTDSPDYWWFSYPVSVIPQKSLKRDIFEAECNLTEITEQVLQFLVPLEEGIVPRRNAERARELYTKLTEWKASLPERLQAENAVLPAAILLHLNVDLIIISILRPFEGFSKQEFGPFDPMTMSYAHTSNAMSTMWYFRALYTLRNEHWLIQACSVCAFRVLFDIDSSPIQLETFTKALRALMELSEAFPVAKDVLLSVETVVRKRKLQLPERAQDHLPGETDGTKTEFTVVKVRDHSVIVEKADSLGNKNHTTMLGLLSAVGPKADGID
ncbi:hypothetical protein FZEAL_3599 [Fusarium zealandicum]|uniref:Cytochrome P450 n=1 Tax=Fusarium zealandicum TaxID=1053134 RepID=A0A8H4XLM6_9HYPO|nr:hypothetical protein FZEAL_3599 [Fusarium zealandicum]